jgi:hypothetical protein
MALLLSTPQITLTTEPDARLVRFVRTSVPYPDLIEFERLHQRIASLLDQLGRKRHVLLVDMREAPMNNNPAFERAAVRGRLALVRDFRRLAVLVKTAVGALQVGRHIREDSLDAPIFNDETAAVSFLLGVSGFDADPAPVSSTRSPRSSRRSGPGSGSER